MIKRVFKGLYIHLLARLLRRRGRTASYFPLVHFSNCFSFFYVYFYISLCTRYIVLINASGVCEFRETRRLLHRERRLSEGYRKCKRNFPKNFLLPPTYPD